MSEQTSNHTPGPWQHGGLHWIGDVNGETVAYVDDHRNSENRPESEHLANARLIAEAPTMLEALQLILSWYDDDSDSTKLVQGVDKARAAIAKVTGE